MDQMKQVGAGGAIMHARVGLLTPYMGEDWLNVISDAAKYGSERKFLVWLYDEEGFPSGYAGGQTIEPNPKDFSANFLVLHDAYECESGKSITIQIPPLVETAEIYGIVAVPVIEALTGYEMVNFPESVQTLDVKQVLSQSQPQSKKEIRWTSPDDGNLWFVMLFVREWNLQAANVLKPDAMQRFIALTHQKYYDHFDRQGLASLFGSTIMGIFTDEPGVMYCNGDKSYRRIVPYTSEIEAYFASIGKYSLLQIIPAAFFDTANHSIQYRVMYWNAVGSSYQQAFFQQIFNWCEAHHIASIGHVANEGNLFNQIRDQVDFFKGARYMSYGSSDQLGGIYRAVFEANYSLALCDNMVTPRLAASAARIYQLPRTSSECFGSSGWALSLERQKILVDWQVANGVNLFFPHDFSYSIEGIRKGDHPPAFNGCGYFPELRVLNDYIARLCYLFSQPAEGGLPRVGILYGNDTVLASMNPGMMQDAFDAHYALPYAVDLLQRLHVDFDILPGDYLGQLQTTEGVLRDKNNSYDVIILPAITLMAQRTSDALIKLIHAGGNVICIQKVPKMITDGLEMPLVNSSNIDQFPIYPHTEKVHQLIHQSDDASRLFFIDTPQNPVYRNHIGSDLAVLFDKFHVFDHRVISTRNEEVGDIVIRRSDLVKPFEGILVFAANVSDKEYTNVSIIIGKNIQYQWEHQVIHYLNAENGSISRLDPTSWQLDANQRIHINWSFSPAESVMFLVTSTGWTDEVENPIYLTSKSLPDDSKSVVVQSITPADWAVSIPHWNILNLEQWTISYSVIQSGERASYLKRAMNQTYTFEITALPIELELILDSLGEVGTGNIEINLNGIKIGPLHKGSRLDHAMFESIGLSASLKAGMNTLTIITSAVLASDLHPLTEPVRLIGSFLATPGTGHWVIQPHIGLVQPRSYDLRDSGLPQYIWPLVYRFDLHIPSLDGTYWLELPKENAPLCKIRFNDGPISLIWYGNYRARLPNFTSHEVRCEIEYIPYPTNLYESAGVNLGFSRPILLRKMI
nr:hypothetical protein [Candidatus Sigynarchaeota archaeon]